MFDAHAQKMLAYYSNIIVMLQIFDNLFHYKNIVTVLWINILSYQGLRLSKGRYDETFAGEDCGLNVLKANTEAHHDSF